MRFHLLVLACVLLLLPGQASGGPKEKVAALAPSGVVLVLDEKGNELVAQNADKPFVPASVAKIVTAWLALEVLGPDYRFETRFYLDADRVLYIRGGGDPSSPKSWLSSRRRWSPQWFSGGASASERRSWSPTMRRWSCWALRSSVSGGSVSTQAALWRPARWRPVPSW